jgi:hypothetical protein
MNKPKITFNYSRSSRYKNYPIDGVFGGVLPSANIWFDVFVEKGRVPETVECEIDVKTGTVTEIKNLLVKNEVERELQAGFTMNLETAKILRKWLDEKISVIESELKKSNKP